MPHSVKLILQSEFQGSRITTLLLRYWRSIHAEFMTHRAFNRNAGSSRAIPVEKMLDMVVNDTAGPVHWGKNQKGMQAGEECRERVIIPVELNDACNRWAVQEGCEPGFDEKGVWELSRESAWRFSAWLAAQMSGAFSAAGYHKQIANRLTEPFQYIQVVVTSTQWQNFYDLRCHPDAMPEFRMLAEDMRAAIEGAIPQMLKVGQWHVPFLEPGEDLLPQEVQLKLSAARCASTSYKTVEGQPMSIDKAEQVFEKLMGSQPFHASPTEHQARACGRHCPTSLSRSLLPPWEQYRALIEEGVRSF